IDRINTHSPITINYWDYLYYTTLRKDLVMIISYLIILLIIIFDFVTKQIFSSIYAVGEVDVIINDILVFGYVQNRGASFGILEGQQLVFFILTLLALGLFGYLFSKSDIKTK